MPQARILVVEDDDTIRQLLIDFLRSLADVTTDGARDGVEALHRIATSHYEVVVLDLMMPKMSGVDLLGSLAAMDAEGMGKPAGGWPAVLVITGAADAAIPTELLEHRFPAFVRGVFRKPVDVGALAAAVQRLLPS